MGKGSRVTGQGSRATQVLHPGLAPRLRWEVDLGRGRFGERNLFAGCTAPGFLEGPRRESQPFGGEVRLLYGPTQAGRNVILGYDPETEFVHIAAGSACGYLDGPFSRARFGTASYGHRPSWAHTPDQRYWFMTDVANQHALRRFDVAKQEVTTIRRTKGFGGMTANEKGQLLLIEGDALLWLGADGKQEKSLRLKLQESIAGIGGAGASLALDDVHGWLYATVYGPKQWYIWYWDLKDGSFHGVLPVPAKDAGRKMNEPGPFVGTRIYGEGSVFFGPDDPQMLSLFSAGGHLRSLPARPGEERNLGADGHDRQGKTAGRPFH